ncbi:unnamed protein product [Allacma fusca]|uniref:Uncharacterized protein n=1 Tax=Allacma fusca TaxID=39272 RepID=A0A8J2LKP6_9HEXA|nr:unnamed protein product [Allacma fusca]
MLYDNNHTYITPERTGKHLFGTQSQDWILLCHHVNEGEGELESSASQSRVNLDWPLRRLDFHYQGKIWKELRLG